MATQNPSARAAGKLVAELAKRIQSPVALDEPYVLQDRIPQTRTRHVAVIWDRWANLERAERSDIILDAYESAGILKNDTISVAIGLTQQEAMQMGYLPYNIVTLRKNSDPVTLEQLRNAMEDVGGVHVRTGKLLQLRYPTVELAQEAYRQLIEKVPGPYWGISKEMSDAKAQ